MGWMRLGGTVPYEVARYSLSVASRRLGADGARSSNFSKSKR
jgi:hypothetical protein